MEDVRLPLTYLAGGISYFLVTETKYPTSDLTEERKVWAVISEGFQSTSEFTAALCCRGSSHGGGGNQGAEYSSQSEKQVQSSSPMPLSDPLPPARSHISQVPLQDHCQHLEPKRPTQEPMGARNIQTADMSLWRQLAWPKLETEEGRSPWQCSPSLERAPITAEEQGSWQ